MRNIVLAIAAMALLPASMAAAEQSGIRKSDKSRASARPLPLKDAARRNSCADYGPGFAKIEGTETCMKIGGAVSIGVGSSSGWR
ncbi:porin [Bradyrhizobium sp. URHD0069]|uniref:porin n=1 Tax=Bradyrhizobium sp. URHD0069 TaxID=1380355 RepID=UPI000495D59A|nr:porin [Bradyrhizobium sp. URHD0069]